MFHCLTVHRDRRSGDLTSHPPSHSEEELEDSDEAVENEEVREEHVYHSLERQDNPSVTEPVYTQPLKLLKVRFLKHLWFLPSSLPTLRMNLAKADCRHWLIVKK